MIDMTGSLLATDAAGPYFQWVDCATGEPIADATGPSFEAPAPGNYAVEAGTIYCMPLSECVEVIITGIEPQQHPIGITTFPNPVNDVLTIQLDRRHSGADLRLLDLRGGTVRTERMPPGDRWNMHVAGIPAGAYLLEVRTAGRVQRALLVKD